MLIAPSTLPIELNRTKCLQQSGRLLQSIIPHKWSKVSPSPEAGGERPASVAVQEVDGEAFEGVSVWHGSPHSVLELLVTAGDARASLQLVGCQG